MKTSTSNPTPRGQALATTLFLLTGGGALAGGHFDVDDAGTLDPGQCQYELWANRHRAIGGDPVRGLHLGPACRVGPFEVGLNVDRFSVRGERSTVIAGPQVKWTFFGQQPDAPLAAALSVSASFDVTHGGRTGGQFVVPLTWRATESLQVHANLGADWLPVSGARTGRGGLALEWAMNPQVSLIAERNRAFGLWTSRAGVRFNLTPLISIDVSASRAGTREERVRGVVIGVNHAFDWR